MRWPLAGLLLALLPGGPSAISQPQAAAAGRAVPREPCGRRAAAVSAVRARAGRAGSGPAALRGGHGAGPGCGLCWGAGPGRAALGMGATARKAARLRRGEAANRFWTGSSVQKKIRSYWRGSSTRPRKRWAVWDISYEERLRELGLFSL